MEDRVWHTFERCVEHEAADADKEIPGIGDCKHGVVAMFPAAFDALVGEMEEEEIGQCVDALG